MVPSCTSQSSCLALSSPLGDSSPVFSPGSPPGTRAWPQGHSHLPRHDCSPASTPWALLCSRGSRRGGHRVLFVEACVLSGTEVQLLGGSGGLPPTHRGFGASQCVTVIPLGASRDPWKCCCPELSRDPPTVLTQALCSQSSSCPAPVGSVCLWGCGGRSCPPVR